MNEQELKQQLEEKEFEIRELKRKLEKLMPVKRNKITIIG